MTTRVKRASRHLAQYLLASEALPPALVRPARCSAICNVLCAAGPELAPRDQEVLADVFLFIFALDDLIDEGQLTDDEVELRLRQYQAVAQGEDCPEVAYDPIARCLLGLSERLRRGPLGQALWPLWSRRVCQMLEAMGFEHRAAAAARAGGPLPDLEEYLRAGRHSVAIAFFCMSAWMLIGEQAVVGRMADLVRAERHLSLAARLANDLRSAPREQAEGGINALRIVGPAGAVALRARIQHELRAGRRILAACGPAVGLSAAYLDRFVTAVVALYETRDFHTDSEVAALACG